MDGNLKILVLEDNPADAELAANALRHADISFVLDRVETKSAFEKSLTLCPDIILADYSLPSFDALSALKIARQKCPGAPFIVISGTISDVLAVELMREGATDYVSKEHLAVLPAAVTRALAQAKERLARTCAEEAAHQSAREWRETFDAIVDSITIIDIDGRIRRYNQATENMLGKTKIELEGNYCYKVVHGLQHPIPECPVVRMKASKGRETLEVETGNRWFQVMVDPVLDKEGQLVGAVHIMQDITARKKMEHDLQEERKLLERYYHLTIGRELKMAELKEHIAKLKAKAKE